jgi:hypothetical protein
MGLSDDLIFLIGQAAQSPVLCKSLDASDWVITPSLNVRPSY